MPSKIRWTLFAAVVVASIWTARPARAQDTSKGGSTSKSDINVVLSESAVEDIQRAADQLAIAVQEAVRKATEDPAVKVAALKVAKNAVVAAQAVIAQQAETLQTVLNTLAREIAQATEKQQSKVRSH